ncbi:MAG: SsrA-binding protein SmpB [Planctomycetota bacterium]
MAKQPSNQPAIKIIAQNRRARFEFEILEKYEVGMVLLGTEVKSLRQGKCNLADAYVNEEDGELWIVHLDIPEYTHGNRMNHEPKRRRKLLLHRQEIMKIRQRIREKGLTVVPLSLYFKDSRAKMAIALVRGKNVRDKRAAMAKREAKREIDKELSRRR